MSAKKATRARKDRKRETETLTAEIQSETLRRNRLRMLRSAWILLPFPLLNPVLLPLAFLALYPCTLITLYTIHASPQSVFLVTQEQMTTYGAGYYKAMMVWCLGFMTLAALLWYASFLFYRKARMKFSDPATPLTDGYKPLLLPGLGFIALSFVSGVLLIWAIGPMA